MILLPAPIRRADMPSAGKVTLLCKKPPVAARLLNGPDTGGEIFLINYLQVLLFYNIRISLPVFPSNRFYQEGKMKTVGDLLDEKGHEVLSISPDAMVYDAIELMARHEIGALVVMDGNRVVGMLSERDYARKIILQDRSSRSTRIDEIMTRDIVFVQAEESIEECMSLMTQNRIRHLPVLQDGNIAGIVSIGDLVKSIISEQQSTIDLLERYISA